MLLKQYISISLLLISVLLFSCSKEGIESNDSNSIKIGITTTLNDSMIAQFLVDEFEKNHKLTVKMIVAGSGQIHELIKRGDIDSAITHDPAGENALIENKLIDKRIPLVKNDFVLVGPSNDPAHIKHSLTPDEAFKKIHNAKATFISRGDNSGTNQMELKWRSKISQEEDHSIITTGTGMGASLTVAAEKNAYILVDRATWLQYENKQNLTVLFEDSEYLPNEYSLLSFNKNDAKSDKIKQWETWLSSGLGLELLKEFRIDQQTVFQP